MECTRDERGVVRACDERSADCMTALIEDIFVRILNIYVCMYATYGSHFCFCLCCRCIPSRVLQMYPLPCPAGAVHLLRAWHIPPLHMQVLFTYYVRNTHEAIRFEDTPVPPAEGLPVAAPAPLTSPSTMLMEVGGGSYGSVDTPMEDVLWE